MRLFGWFKPTSNEDARLEKWRQQWAAAAEQPTAERIQALAAQLQELGLNEDDMEIEREMLDALERVVALISEVEANGLPMLETGHRIAGADRCHFSAPASMPDDPGQPAGRLLLTSARVAFAGGAASRTVPWHAIGEAVHQERDLVMIRVDRETLYRFRCNTYGDALCAAFVARRVIAGRGRTGGRAQGGGPARPTRL